MVEYFWPSPMHSKSDNYLPCPNNLEVVNVEVDCAFTLCLIYHPPNANDQYNSFLLSFLISLDFAKNVAIVGDMNLPDVD